MFSSDACCFRNGQLKQLNDGEGWEKQKHFIQAKTVEKIHAKKFMQKNLQKIQPLTILYTIFHEKGSPFVYLRSVTNGSPSTYLVLNFLSLLIALNALFFLHRNQSQK